MFDNFDDYEFEHGEKMHSDYDPDHMPDEPKCCYPAGFWKEPVCTDPVDGGSPFCRAHSNYVDLSALVQAIEDGDAERIETKLDDMGLTLDDLKVRAELKLAA